MPVGSLTAPAVHVSRPGGGWKKPTAAGRGARAPQFWRPHFACYFFGGTSDQDGWQVWLPLKRLRGNPGKRRLHGGPEPTRTEEPPEPLSFLSEAAQAEW
jgi:hypothetical protein